MRCGRERSENCEIDTAVVLLQLLIAALSVIVASLVIREWPTTTPIFALIFLTLSVGEMVFCTYLSDHHEELEWMGGGVLQLSAFVGVFLFILGFAFAANVAIRGRQSGNVRLLNVLPLILYFVCITYWVIDAWVS